MKLVLLIKLNNYVLAGIFLIIIIIYFKKDTSHLIFKFHTCIYESQQKQKKKKNRMTVDISKVFKANVKAIRVSLNDSSETTSSSATAAINEELFGGSKKKTKLITSASTVPETRKIASQVAQEARNIVNIYFK